MVKIYDEFDKSLLILNTTSPPNFATIFARSQHPLTSIFVECFLRLIFGELLFYYTNTEKDVKIKQAVRTKNIWFSEYTVPIDRILSVKNAWAWVSMDFT